MHGAGSRTHSLPVLKRDGHSGKPESLDRAKTEVGMDERRPTAENDPVGADDAARVDVLVLALGEAE